MDRLNELEKYSDAGIPLGSIQFAESHGGWWAVCPLTGFGYFYKSLHEAVKRWNVVIVGYNDGVWEAEKIVKGFGTDADNLSNNTRGTP